MPKIQNIGLGNYIRNPRGRHISGGTKIELLQIASNEGNSFLCYPVTGKNSSQIIVDTTRYYYIPIDTDVEQATP